jgi:spore coat protein U-like protein
VTQPSDQYADRGRHARQPARLVAAILLLTAYGAWAECEVSATGVSFGSYNPLDQMDLEGSGIVGVACDASTTYSISLSSGRGSFSSRAMTTGAHELLYNLYTAPTYTSIWGDGTGNTVTVGTTGLNEEHTVYGLIPSRQNAFVGNYVDTIVVTLTF